MPEEINLEKIDSMEAIYAVNATLRRIDERLVDHGERTAYFACRLCDAGKLNMDKKILFLLSVFHDIGAYKTEEIDHMLEFETKDVGNHSIYGYLFLKYLTPLHEYSEAILYHHSSWETIEKAHIAYGEYAALIHLADRMDVGLVYSAGEEELMQLLTRSKSLYKEEYLDIAMNCLKEERDFLEPLKDGSFHEENLRLCKNFVLSAKEALEYLKMVVYSIDFRSDHTVTHTINTMAISLNIARHFQMDEEEMENIYIGALLHDIGKIAIPFSILESPGKLSEEEMKIMRTHVEETRHLIDGIVPEEIEKLALRHHEKLDGSGYPEGLKAEDLTFSQRIVAVADIVSALSSRRSYKEPFPKEKTLAIIGQMSKEQLDPDICQYIMEHYNEIVQQTEKSRMQIIDRYQQIQREYESMKG